MSNKNIIKKLKKKNVITTYDFTDNNLHRSLINDLVHSGEYYKVRRGIYQRSDEWEDDYYIIQTKYKRGIYSFNTALYLLGYSDRVPLSLHLTFPKGYNTPSLKNENVIITRVNKDNYELGISEIITPFGNKVRVYDIERCLCDILRGKGEDIQIVQSAMKKYVKSKNKDINKLMKYAKQLRVEEKVRRYIEILL